MVTHSLYRGVSQFGLCFSSEKKNRVEWRLHVKFCVKYLVEDLSVGTAVLLSATGDQPVLFLLITIGSIVATALTLDISEQIT